MSDVVVSDPARVWAFVNDVMPIPVVAGMKGLGLERDGELIAGVLYEGHSGPNVWMHVASKPGTRWTNRAFMRLCFDYPFNQLGCKRVTGFVDASNTAAREFDERLGFKPEAVLKGAAADGGDVVIYVMWQDDCRFLEQ